MDKLLFVRRYINASNHAEEASMSISTEIQQLLLPACALVVAASSVAAVIILATLRKEISHLLRPTTSERVRRLLAQAEANRALLETPTGRIGLVEFFVSEANISAFFRETEKQVQEATSDEEMRRVLERIKSGEENKPWYSLDRLNKGAKAIGEKLFDKANDLIKPYLGGSDDM